MSSSLTTTYFGYRITIEPVEWGYRTSVYEPASGRRLVAMSTSAMQALDGAFDIVDEASGRPRIRQAGNSIRSAPQARSFGASEP